MRLSEMLGREVITDSGASMGRLGDIRGEIDGDVLVLTGLVTGKAGVLERFGIGTHGSGGPGRAKVRGRPVIPWERVRNVGAKIVVDD